MFSKKITFFLLALIVIVLIQWVFTSDSFFGSPEDNKTNSENNTEQHQAVGNTGMNQKQMEQELDKLIDMIDRHPKSAKLYAERSTIFMMMNKPVQALSDIEAAVDLDPGNAEFLTNRAMAYRKFERFDDAMNDLNKALEINPDLLAAYFNRGVLNFGLKKYKKAIDDFTKCIDNAPNAEQPLFNRAFSYEQIGEMKLAKIDLKKFISITESHDAKIMAENKLEEWSKIDYKTLVDKSALQDGQNLINPHQ